MTGMTTKLAALIGSRICHDLISPIGAINNGLELLCMSGAQTGPEMGLIGESVDNASARIRFFRIAFGAAGEQMVGPPEVHSILRDLYGEGRLKIEWGLNDSMQRKEVRLAFLAILCAETALPYGGKIVVSANGDQWSLEGRGDRINVDDKLWALLSGGPQTVQVQPSQVQFALLPLIASDDGRRVTCQSDETSLRIEF